MVKVLICDDQMIVTEGLQKILNAAPNIEVVAVAYDGSEALEMTAHHKPDIVLMDLKMPVMNGIIATRKLRASFPDLKVLILTTYDDDEWIFDAIRAGAAGYLLKDTPPHDLITAIHGTVSGKSYLDPNVAGKLLHEYARGNSQPAPSHYQFSEREQDVLRLLAQGLSNADIAQQLYLTEGTVRNYTSEILKKLGVADRTQAAILAIRYGLVDES
ncbi:MAG: response regulator transcription factor [Anaerolineales bacterium]|nr:response regulator transcription factor [Anaerolineales bacterium]